MSDLQATFSDRGWIKFDHDPDLAEWVEAARPAAFAAMRDPAHAMWWRSGGTWFVGVNALPNDAFGRVGDGPVLKGRAIEFARGLTSAFDWDKGQVSAVLPGYPVQSGESDAAFAFRRDRDAAHVDGLKKGRDGKRYAGEFHGFLLGIPLNDCGAGASLLVVWDRSHLKMQAFLRAQLQGVAVQDWASIDLTEAYSAARRAAFDDCQRITLSARPGEAYIVHRHALHGISPWATGASAPAEGRVIVYFRPPLRDPEAWL